MKVLHIGNEKNVENYTAKTPFMESVEVVNAPLGLTEDAYAQMAPDAEVIIVDAITEISEELMEKLPALKMIHSEGVAFNKIDLAAAGKRGIYVCNCAGMNAKAVAEQTLLLMLGVVKNVVSGDRAVRSFSFTSIESCSCKRRQHWTGILYQNRLSNKLNFGQQHYL